MWPSEANVYGSVISVTESRHRQPPARALPTRKKGASRSASSPSSTVSQQCPSRSAKLQSAPARSTALQSPPRAEISCTPRWPPGISGGPGRSGATRSVAPCWGAFTRGWRGIIRPDWRELLGVPALTAAAGKVVPVPRKRDSDCSCCVIGEVKLWGFGLPSRETIRYQRKRQVAKNKFFVTVLKYISRYFVCLYAARVKVGLGG